MGFLVGAGHAQCGGQFHLLAGGQGAGRRGLRHGFLGHPVLVVIGRHPRGHACRRRDVVPQPLGVKVAPQRVDHGRDHDDAAQGAVDRRGPVGIRQGRVTRVIRPHAQEHGLVRAAGGAHCADFARDAVPCRSLALAPADSVVDIGEGSGIGGHRRDAEVQGRHDDAVAGQGLVRRVAVQAVSTHPGAAVQLDHDREGPAALGTEQPRQQGSIAVAKIFHVLDVNFVGCCLFAGDHAEPPVLSMPVGLIFRSLQVS